MTIHKDQNYGSSSPRVESKTLTASQSAAPARALTIKKAVTYTGLSRSQIYRALKDKRLFRLKAGRRTLLLTEELDAYLLSLREEKLE